MAALGHQSTIVTALVFGIALVAAVLIWLFVAHGITGTINKVVGQLTQTSGQIGSAASQVSSISHQMAEGAGDQASSIEETSSSLEELSSMTRQNYDNVRQADTLGKEARENIMKVNQKLAQMMAAIKDVEKNSDETQKIVKTIDEIAFQTNLLALNAAVEAARAGEAGAGFAVVAEEVRNLAIRSAEAAKNTSDLIGNTVNSVKEGASLCGEANEAFKNDADITEKTSKLVSEIASASQEQSTGIEQINRAVAELDTVTQQNAANAEESAAASEEMNAHAERLINVVEDLVEVVGKNDNSAKNSFHGTRKARNKMKAIAVSEDDITPHC
jgi:methyl-accepting chemotaxis protein